LLLLGIPVLVVLLLLVVTASEVLVGDDEIAAPAQYAIGLAGGLVDLVLEQRGSQNERTSRGTIVTWAVYWLLPPIDPLFRGRPPVWERSTQNGNRCHPSVQRNPFIAVVRQGGDADRE